MEGCVIADNNWTPQGPNTDCQNPLLDTSLAPGSEACFCQLFSFNPTLRINDNLANNVSPQYITTNICLQEQSNYPIEMQSTTIDSPFLF